MKQLALSIERMKTLEKLGLDISRFERVYYSNLISGLEFGEYELVVQDFPGPHDKRLMERGAIVPAMTLEDILETLPRIPYENGLSRQERTAILAPCSLKGDTRWCCSYGSSFSEIYADTPLDAAYLMLIWCLENKYL